MKLSISRETLRDLSKTAASAVMKKTTLPVLMNVLIEADAEGVRMTATDLDTTIRVRGKAEVETPGTVAVPAALLADIAAKLPAGAVKIEATKDKATVSAGRSRFTLPTIPAEEFPTDMIPAFDGEPWEITGDQLSAIAALGFAVSTEEARPTLNGVHLHTDGDDLVAVATNGHRMALLRLPGGNAADLPLTEVVVHPRALRQAAMLFEGQTVAVRRGTKRKSMLSLVGENAELHTGLIEGPYPTYTQVVPTEFGTSLTCNRKALIEALDRVKVAAPEQTHRITLHLNGALSLSAHVSDGAEAHDEVAVQHAGPEMRMALSARYLGECLSFLGAEEIEWKWTTSERASVMGPVNDDSAMLLLMPLRLIG